MKICFWLSKIFTLGGTRKITTMLANELSKDNEVYILTPESRKQEDRSLNGMNDDVNILFYESREFSRDIGVKRRLEIRAMIKANNSRDGLLDKHGRPDMVADAFFPVERQDRFVEYFNKHDFDVVIATATTSLFLAIIAPRLKAKTVGWQHSSYDSYFGQKGMLFWNKEETTKKYFPNLDAYIVLSEHDVRKFKENLGLTVRDFNNPVTIECDKTSDLTSKNFLIAARFERAKGVDIALRAFEEFCGRNDDWTLVIAGDGGQRTRLFNYAWKNGIINRVKFLGTTSDMPSCYLDSSVYLMTSRWEGWGLVVTEAFAMGVPVIAFDIPPMDLIIDDGVNGIIVKSEEGYNVKEYAKAMLQLANDDELRRKMGAAAHEKSKQYSMEVYVQKWKDLFSEITEA